MRSTFAATLGLVLLFGGLSATVSGCRDHDDDLDDNELSQADNDDRLGRKVIRCSVAEVDGSVIEGILGPISNRAAPYLSAAGRAPNATSIHSRAAGSVLVPVIMHVISSGPLESDGNVSDGAIAAQIQALNEGFAGAEGGINTAFRFQLSGITRTVNPAWAAMAFDSAEELEAKAALRQGNAATLNVYLTRPSDGTLGWATFPWDYMTDPSRDGVVIDYQTVPGGALPPYNEGDTLVHEVGHWMGLLHTFQGSCAAENDTIADTPAEDRPSFGCPVGRNSCGSDAAPDPIENYMDYSDDSCLLTFTAQQAERIDAVCETLRGL